MAGSFIPLPWDDLVTTQPFQALTPEMKQQTEHRYFKKFGKEEAARAFEKLGLPPLLGESMVMRESSGDPLARSNADAFGLLQLTADAATDVGANRTIPSQNVKGGAAFLRRQLDTFGDLPKAIAAYHAGPGNVQEALDAAGDGWFDYLGERNPTTRQYVEGLLGDIGGDARAVTPALTSEQALAELSKRLSPPQPAPPPLKPLSWTELTATKPYQALSPAQQQDVHQRFLAKYPDDKTALPPEVGPLEALPAPQAAGAPPAPSVLDQLLGAWGGSAPPSIVAPQPVGQPPLATAPTGMPGETIQQQITGDLPAPAPIGPPMPAAQTGGMPYQHPLLRNQIIQPQLPPGVAGPLQAPQVSRGLGADIATALPRGVTGTAKTFGNVGQAVVDLLTALSPQTAEMVATGGSLYPPNLAPTTPEQQQQQTKDQAKLGEQMKAPLEGIVQEVTDFESRNPGWFLPSQEQKASMLRDALVQGPESAVQSLAVGVPALLAGGLPGLVLSGGALFSAGEWTQADKDIQKFNKSVKPEHQVPPEVATQIKAIRAIAEGGGEMVSNFVGGKLLGLDNFFKGAGKEALTKVLTPSLQKTLARVGGVAVTETTSEMGTAAVQAEANRLGAPTAEQREQDNIAHRQDREARAAKAKTPAEKERILNEWPTSRPNFAANTPSAMGAALEAGPSALVASLIFAGLGLGAQSSAHRKVRESLSNPATASEERLQSARVLSEAIKTETKNEDLANGFYQAAEATIKRGEPIDLGLTAAETAAEKDLPNIDPLAPESEPTAGPTEMGAERSAEDRGVTLTQDGKEFVVSWSEGEDKKTTARFTSQSAAERFRETLLQPEVAPAGPTEMGEPPAAEEQPGPIDIEPPPVSEASPGPVTTEAPPSPTTAEAPPPLPEAGLTILEEYAQNVLDGKTPMEGSAKKMMQRATGSQTSGKKLAQEFLDWRQKPTEAAPPVTEPVTAREELEAPIVAPPPAMPEPGFPQQAPVPQPAAGTPQQATILQPAVGTPQQASVLQPEVGAGGVVTPPTPVVDQGTTVSAPTPAVGKGGSVSFSAPTPDLGGVRQTQPQIGPAQRKPVEEMPVLQAPTQALTPETIHAAADKAQIPWDDDPAFMAWSKELTGTDKLDEMDQDQLTMMETAIERGEKPPAGTVPPPAPLPPVSASAGPEGATPPPSGSVPPVSLDAMRRVRDKKDPLKPPDRAAMRQALGIQPGSPGVGDKKLVQQYLEKFEQPAEQALPVPFQIGDEVTPTPGSGLSAKNGGKITHLGSNGDLKTEGSGRMSFPSSDFVKASPTQTPPPVAAPAATAPSRVRAPKASPQAPLSHEGWTALGRNDDGDTVYEDKDSVRSFVDQKNRRFTAPPALIRSGLYKNTSYDAKWPLKRASAPTPAPPPTETPPPAPEVEAPTPEYGSTNKLVSRERADEIRKRLRAKLNQANIGIDPEVLSLGAELAVFHIEAGARAFTDFTKAVVGDLGDKAQPYLKSWYLAARNWPGMDKTGMQTEAELDALPEEEPAPVVQEETPPTETSTPADPVTASQAVADWVKSQLESKSPFTNQDLFDEADIAFGGTQGQGTYTAKDSYDAMEMGVNQYVLENREIFSPSPENNQLGVGATRDERLKARHVFRERHALNEAHKLLQFLPTPSRRSAEQDEFQQFSTPPTEAFVAAWAANILPEDVVLEPSAGLGGLAAFAKNAGVTTIVNELSSRRAALLTQMGFDRVFTENAEQIHNILPADVQPTVVLMNPPFSSTAGRIKGQRKTTNAIAHVEQALKRLQPNGRLVAIVGQGMNDTAPTFRDWWKKIKGEYNVRANISVPGAEYAKYGTTFGNQLVVIDKTGPTPVGGTRTGSPASLREVVPLLEGIRNDRPEISQGGEQLASEPTRETAPEPSRGEAGPEQSLPPPIDDLGSGERDGETGAEDTGRSGGVPGDVVGTPPEKDAQISAGMGEERGGGEPDRGAAPSGGGRGELSEGAPASVALRDDGTERPVGGGVAEPEPEELTESVYESYRPAKLQVTGARPHVSPLVQSAAMASVDPPVVTYTPTLPQEMITSGKISAAQLEAVTYAGQAHGRILPNGMRQGYFVGDGCVAAGTRIYNPLTNEHLPIEILVARGVPHVVLSLTHAGLVPRWAHVPFLKGEANLYRIVLESGRVITVTDEHRFLTPHGWKALKGGLRKGDALACVGTDQSEGLWGEWRVLRENGLNCSDTPEDCLDDYSLYLPLSRVCDDARSHPVQDSGLAVAPLQDDVLARNRSYWRGDVQALSVKYSHLRPHAFLHSKNNSFPLAIHAPSSTGDQASVGSAQRLNMLRSADQLFPIERVSLLHAVDEVFPYQYRYVADLFHPVSEVEPLFVSEKQPPWEVLPQIERLAPRLMSLFDRPPQFPLLVQPEAIPSVFSSNLCSRWDRVVNVDFIRTDVYYDMYVPGPENYVAEGIVHHNTGVGKGRTNAAIIADNWNQGRTKAMWVSANNKLLQDATRDVAGIGDDPKKLFPLSGVNANGAITRPEGILFATYATLGKTAQPDKKTGEPGKKRLDQIVEWAGEDFEGTIIFDESHALANAISDEGGGGRRGKAASQQALAGVALQRRLPKARIVYVSATGATEVRNLAYAERLGLWGEGTPFADVRDFTNKISAGGLAAMELVARDMKAKGLYLARSLSFDGVTYETLEHPLTDDQREIYNVLARAWQTVLQNINQALELTEAKKNSQAKANAMNMFWSGHQRFFNQVLTSLQMPSVLTRIRQDIDNGDAIVLQLVNTLQAAQNRKIAELEEATDEEGQGLESLDLTPREGLMDLVRRGFPTQQYEEYEDDDGNRLSRPVVDSTGEPVENPEAIAMREALLDQLGAVRVPEGPLDILFNTFGEAQVAEVTGRSQRVLRTPDGKVIKQALSTKKMLVDAKAFMDDKKRLLIFSNAGGTGQSYHADLGVPNQRKRRHYLIQPGWQADRAVQGMGRTHRTNEKEPPHYVLVTTDVKGQKRFISSIARRLDQLGSLTKGQRQTGSQGLFSARDNLESQYATDALRRFWVDLHRHQIEGLNFRDVANQMGLLGKLIDKHGRLNQDLPPITQFLNRVLSLDLETQSAVFDAFSERMDQNIARAIAENSLDIGMENLKAKSARLVKEQPVYTDPQSGAQTNHVELELTHDRKFTKFEAARQKGGLLGFYRHPTSQRLSALYPAAARTTEAGVIEQRYVSTSPTSTQAMNETDFAKLEAVDEKEAKAAWNAVIADASPTYTTQAHLLTGALLPIWDRLTGNVRVVRTQTTDGKRYLGRLINEDDIDATLDNLGVTAPLPEVTPADLVTQVVENNASVDLVNGWTIKRSRVGGEPRLEIVGPDYREQAALVDQGAFTERIQYVTRTFLPTGDQAEAVLDRVLASRPVKRVRSPQQSAADVLQARTNESGFIASDLLTAPARAAMAAGRFAKRTMGNRSVELESLLGDGRGEEAFGDTQWTQGRIGTQQANMIERMGDLFTNKPMMKILTQVTGQRRASYLSRFFRSFEGIGEYFGIPASRQEKLFEAAESIKEFSGNTPTFGTRIFEKDPETKQLIRDQYGQPIMKEWRYTPDQGEQFWKGLNDQEKAAVQYWVEIRSVMKEVFNVSGEIEGYVHHFWHQGFFEGLGHMMGRHTRLKKKTAGARLGRKDEEGKGFSTDFERSIIKVWSDLIVEKEWNDMMKRLVPLVTDPVGPDGVREGWELIPKTQPTRRGQFLGQIAGGRQIPKQLYDEMVAWGEPVKDASKLAEFARSTGSYMAANLMLHPGTMDNNILGSGIQFASLWADTAAKGMITGQWKPFLDVSMAPFLALLPSHNAVFTPEFLGSHSNLVTQYQPHGPLDSFFGAALSPITAVDNYVKRSVAIAFARSMGLPISQKDILANKKAYIELRKAIDTTGLDYGNVNSRVEKFRAHPLGRFLSLFVTYPYKAMQHMGHYLSALNPAAKMEPDPRFQFDQALLVKAGLTPEQMERISRLMVVGAIFSLLSALFPEDKEKVGKRLPGMPPSLDRKARLKVSETPEGKERYWLPSGHPWFGPFLAVRALKRWARTGESPLEELLALGASSFPSGGPFFAAYDAASDYMHDPDRYPLGPAMARALVKPLIPGGRIAESIRRQGPGPELKSTTFAQEIAEAAPFPIPDEWIGARQIIIDPVTKEPVLRNPTLEQRKFYMGWNIREIDPPTYDDIRDQITNRIMERLDRAQNVQEIDRALGQLKEAHYDTWKELSAQIKEDRILIEKEQFEYIRQLADEQRALPAQ